MKVVGQAPRSTLTAKGQATIPKPVRDFLRIGPGDQVKFFFHPDGGVMLLPMRPAKALRKLLPRTQVTATLEEIEAAPAEAAAAAYLAGRNR